MSVRFTRPRGPYHQTRLRQIALAASDLKEAERVLTKVLGTNVVYQDPHVEKFGLHNILLCFGGDVLEVVAPYKEGTTAGRLLQKRGGDTGYMIIMQADQDNAERRRQYILKNNLAKVITYGKTKVSTLVQYHPKGIKGGVMPELDSHLPTAEWPAPMTAEISPWGALGPLSRAPLYMTAMRHASHLRLVGVILRLEPDDADTVGAARQWEETFGVQRVKDCLHFTNARMGFVAGLRGEHDGIHSVTVAVEGKERLERMLWAAKEEGLCADGCVKMLGVRWYFIEASESAAKGK